MNPFRRRIIALLGLLAWMAGCDSGGGSSTPASREPGVLPLEGTVFRLGSDDGFASPEERPGWTRFTRDVRMDGTECSQAEYLALRGRNPSKIRGDALPVTDVTWYDAVLVANARSRRDGLDSVYEYTAVRFDSSGAATELDGLAAHLDRDGWRLPTEAEWEAGARAGTSSPWPWGGAADSARADDFAWHRGNAGGVPHPVGSKSANGWGLSDMAGNVMEWVHDWKGAFPRDTVEGFAGRDAPGDVAEVPLKGGSFAHGTWSLRPSCRTATYAAYRSSRAEYVGFRLARGGFAARTLAPSGAVLHVPPVAILQTDVAAKLGARSARLVFVNRSAGRGTLSWIDFGEASPVVRSLPDPDPAFHPAISPDGRWVAWSTGLEGSKTPSRIKVRRLSRTDTLIRDLGEGAIPRWWISGPDTFLVRAEALDNADPTWGSTRTAAQRWSDGRLVDAPVDWGAGSYHDGRSGPWLYTGYRRLRRRDMRTGDERILFVAPENGKTAGDTSQVCNVSAAPDASGRVLLLDFGSVAPSREVGRAYGIHEVAFVLDSTGRVVARHVAPAGERQWEHLEWSNHPRWAVAGAIDLAGAHQHLHVLDLESGVSTLVASGEDLWQPALWVDRAATTGPEPQADADSSGAWNSPATDYTQEEFAIKARAFRAVREGVEIAAVGSSRMKAGIDPGSFTHGLAFNWGFSGADPVADREVLENYVLPHAPRLKVVLLSLMPGWWFDWRGEMVWQKVQASIGYRYDAAHDFWRAGVPDGYDSVVAARSWSASPSYDTLGGTRIDPHWWNLGGLPPCTPPTTEDTSGAIFRKNWADLEAMAALCQARGVHLVLVNFPQDPDYARTACMGKYGPTWETWRILKARLRDLETRMSMVRLVDAHADGAHDYPDSAATNFDHLSWIGAQKLSGRLDSLIGTFR